MCEMRSHEVVCVPPLSTNNLGKSPVVCDVQLFSEPLIRAISVKTLPACMMPPDFNLGYILKFLESKSICRYKAEGKIFVDTVLFKFQTDLQASKMFLK